jgi:hypothetical protein
VFWKSGFSQNLPLAPKAQVQPKSGCAAPDISEHRR